MKFNSSILAAALLAVVAVGCAHKDLKADAAAPAPEVVSSSTTSDDTGSVSASDEVSTGDEVWSDDVESGTTQEKAAAPAAGTTGTTSSDTMGTDTMNHDTMNHDTMGTTHDAKKAKKNKRAKKGMGTTPDETTTTPSDSGTTAEPMDGAWESQSPTDSTIDSNTGTTTSDGM